MKVKSIKNNKNYVCVFLGLSVVATRIADDETTAAFH